LDTKIGSKGDDSVGNVEGKIIETGHHREDTNRGEGR